MTEKLYAEAFKRNRYNWSWKIYHYDETGMKEVFVATSEDRMYRDKDEALDAASDYADEQGLDVEMLF